MTTQTIKHGTQEWHDARKGKITGSTAAAILAPGQAGVRGTPLTEWRRITQELAGMDLELGAPPDADDAADDDGDTLSDILAWGSESERLHAELLRKQGWHVDLNQDLRVDADRPWLAGTPDGTVLADGQRSVLEMKAPVHNFSVWRDEAPMGARVQAAIYMHLLDLDSAVVSALIPPRPRWHLIVRNDEWEAWALDKLDRFWHDHVLADIPPPATGSDGDLEVLKLIYPEHREGTAVRLTDDALVAATRLEHAKAMKKEAEAIEAEAKAIIVAAIGDAEYGILPDGSGFTYRASSRSEPAREARTVSFRTLRFAKQLKVR